MNQAAILRLARQAGLNVEAANVGDGVVIGLSPPDALENFVELMLEHAAKICEDEPYETGHYYATMIRKEIEP